MKTISPRNILVIFSAATLLIACSAKNEDYASMDAKDKTMAYNNNMEQAPASVADSISAGGTPAPVDATAARLAEKIIKTAEIDLRVEDYAKSRAKIDSMVRSANAFIAHENETHDTYRTGNEMVIRVQNKDFDGLVNKLTSVAKELNFKRVNTEDVTAQFVDIQTRLKTKKEIELRYTELLSKAQKIGDILEIEEKIRVIREEIEAKEGELKLLSDRVAYSTINLSFYQTYDYEPVDKPGFFNRMGTALASGWQGLLGFIVGFFYAWPLWIGLAIVGWLLYRLIKRVIAAHPATQPGSNQQGNKPQINKS